MTHFPEAFAAIIQILADSTIAITATPALPAFAFWILCRRYSIRQRTSS